MRKRFLQLILCLYFLSAFSAYAQQVFEMPVVNLDRLGFNPAQCGSNEKTAFFVSNRSDQHLRYSLLQGETFVPKKKVGIGMLVESYQSLLETQNSIRLNFAYRLKTKKGFLQMGLAPIVHNYRINTDNLTIRNQEDALSPRNNVNRWAVNFNAGMLYKTDKLLVSLSAQNISKSLNPLASDYGYLIEYQHYSFFSSYTFSLHNNWKIVPAIYLNHVKNMGNFAALSTKLLHSHFFVGFQYGLPKSWLASAGVFIPTEKKAYEIMLGYSLAQRNNGLLRSLVHEVLLSLAFGSSTDKREKSSLREIKQFRSPIYF